MTGQTEISIQSADSESEDGIVPIERRQLLKAGFVGTLLAPHLATTAAAQTQSFEMQNSAGDSTDYRPPQLNIAFEQFELSWGDVADDEEIEVALDIQPYKEEDVDADNKKEIVGGDWVADTDDSRFPTAVYGEQQRAFGITRFQPQQSNSSATIGLLEGDGSGSDYYILENTDLSYDPNNIGIAGEPDLRHHPSEGSTTLKISDATPTGRAKEYRTRIRVNTKTQGNIGVVDDTFQVIYALNTGLGYNLGRNLGLKYPDFSDPSNYDYVGKSEFVIQAEDYQEGRDQLETLIQQTES